MKTKRLKTKFAITIFMFLVAFALTPNTVCGQNKTVVSLRENLFSFQVNRDDMPEGARYKLFLNKRQIGTINEPFVDLVNSFDLSAFNQKVVILSVANGGNACPQKLVLISFSKGGLIQDKDVRLILVSPQFGNCHEDPSFTANSQSVKINFPWGKNPVAESWLYNGSKLIRTKPRR
ncbi:MAG: hypothetical protein JST84_26030 [Acidobacteria bacterium]|nr:hypothetical protein [Acidobacteriota bacterium]